MTHDLYGRRLLDHLQGYVIEEGMSDEQLCLDCGRSGAGGADVMATVKF